MQENLLQNNLKTSLVQELDARRSSLDLNGFLIFDNKLKEEFCSEAVKGFEELLKTPSLVEEHYEETEKRIFGFEKYHECGEIFKEISDLLINRINSKYKFKSILSMRNKPVLNNKTDKGRWHLDSFNNQYKVFCFLKDVKNKNGALEVIPRTHRPLFKITNGLFKGEYFSFQDLFRGGGRRYTQLNETFVDNLLNTSHSNHLLNVQRGTLVLCNTSLIHRSSVCEEGCRYSLTSYYT